jgi:hypothetical protein
VPAFKRQRTRELIRPGCRTDIIITMIEIIAIASNKKGSAVDVENVGKDNALKSET